MKPIRRVMFTLLCTTIAGLAVVLVLPREMSAGTAVCKRCGHPFEIPDASADARATYTGRGAGWPRMVGPCCSCECEKDAEEQDWDKGPHPWLAHQDEEERCLADNGEQREPGH